ncbi:hypothetical protein GCM10022399_37430 [Terrabacter ginsenosidimutans]|uniref:Uncharacterized protein n=1 Tax=Terrabacter ginsenosidimutans TaxID=490575 RepID=A0ABP7ECG2_9MICO
MNRAHPVEAAASDQSVDAVERCITKLLEEFIRHPFAHRVEHSLHVDLYHSLLQMPAFDQMVRIGNSPHVTRLVHKEWPSVEAVSLRDSRPRRQSYDIAVLDPKSVENSTLNDFSAGRIPAHVAVELGLDYSLKHLDGDIEKLRVNSVERGYLVHFSRKPSRQTQDVEQRIVSLRGVHVAFAHLDVAKGSFRVKGLHERDVRDQAYDPA